MGFDTPSLHLFCGKIAAGKSTLARNLAAAPATVLISEDPWLSGLYPGAIDGLEAYVRCSARLRAVISPHVVDLLRAGLSVALDFPANTVANRRWMRGLIDQSGADHLLHLLDMPDSLCRERMHRRNAHGGHEFAPSDADFDLVTSYFTPPAPEEGFTVKVYREEPGGVSG